MWNGLPWKRTEIILSFLRLNPSTAKWSTPKTDEYVHCRQRWRSSVQSAKARPGADCGSDHELLIAKFNLN